MLNSGQQEIYNECLEWYSNQTSQVFEIAGAAGTGKSYLISEILRGLNIKESNVLAMAYTGAAAIVMRTRGFSKATTIHSALYEIVEYYDYNDINTKYNTPIKKVKFQLKNKEILKLLEIKIMFIDEAFMVPEYMVKDILSFGIPVIACGDPNQLPPIGDNPGFLINNGVHRLTELVRQASTDPIVYLAMRVLNNMPIHNGSYGNVLVCNMDEFNPKMIGYADIIVCGTNKTRDNMNFYVRKLAGFDKFALPVIGERIICRQNNWQISKNGIVLVNGLAGTVIRQADALAKDGRTFNLDFLPDNSNTLFDSLDLNYEYFSSDFTHRKELKETSFDMPWIKGEFFEYAYALTTHLTQGSEYNNGIIMEEFLRPNMQKPLMYTAITRFKNSFILLKNNPKKSVSIHWNIKH